MSASRRISTRSFWLGMGAAVILVAAYAGPSAAGEVTLSGGQEVPAVTTSASGKGSITVAADKTVSGSVTTTGVQGTAAHIHEAAQGIKTAVQKAGPQSFGMFSCSKTTNELNFLAQKFARTVIGSNNIDSCNRT